jgi:hypothetical protein
MRTTSPAAAGRPVRAPAVNCTPWPVLNTSGRPVVRAASRISLQNDSSIRIAEDDLLGFLEGCKHEGRPAVADAPPLKHIR